jgi:hypothetical protein
VLAKHAHPNGLGLRAAALGFGGITADQFDAWVDPGTCRDPAEATFMAAVSDYLTSRRAGSNVAVVAVTHGKVRDRQTRPESTGVSAMW